MGDQYFVFTWQGTPYQDLIPCAGFRREWKNETFTHKVRNSGKDGDILDARCTKTVFGKTAVLEYAGQWSKVRVGKAIIHFKGDERDEIACVEWFDEKNNKTYEKPAKVEVITEFS